MVDPEAGFDFSPTLILPARRTFSAQTRGKGKRERTRARLIDATAEIIANGGTDAVTVSELTDIAGVAKGTFYNYFNDISEIIIETSLSIMEEIATQINAEGKEEQDPVVRMAAGTRRFIDFAVAHPTWAWAVLRSIDYLPNLRPKVYEYVGSAVEFGKERGDFNTSDKFIVFLLNSVLFGAARARLLGRVGSDAGERAAEVQLLALGVDPDRARAASRCKIKKIDFSLMQPSGTQVKASGRARKSSRSAAASG